MKKNCQAYVDTTASRCKKRALGGSKYCWSHQSKMPVILSLLIGAVIGQFTNVAWDRFSESAEEAGVRKILNVVEKMHIRRITDHDELNRKYPEGYYLFATNERIILPFNQTTRAKFTLDWENSKVPFIDDSIVYIELRYFKYTPTNIELKFLNVLLERRPGSVADGLFFEDTGMYVELLESDADQLIYVIGFKKAQPITGQWKLKPEVKRYLDKFKLTLMGRSINMNRRRFLEVIGPTITSGWYLGDK